MHRLWSVDWFQRPAEELDRLVAAIESAKEELSNREAARPAPARAVPVELVSVEREDVVEIGLQSVEEARAGLVIPYAEALVQRPISARDDIHLTPTGTISHLAEQVVAREGPVHIDEVTARIRDAWGAGRAGGRIRDAVERAVMACVAVGRMIREADFLWEPGCVPAVRDRGQVHSLGLRKPEMLPPTELRAAIQQVVRVNFGATAEEVGQAVSRDLGFKATSSQLRATIAAAVERAIADEDVVRQDRLLVLGPGAAQSVGSPMTDNLLSLIAQGEGERLEFKQTLRFDVETKVVNRKLEDVVIKTIAGFTNSAGGTLFIGVCDDETIAGIEPDWATLSKASRDGFDTLCRVDVQRSPTPVVVKLPDRHGAAVEHFYVRSGASTSELSLGQIAAFMSSRRP